MNGPHEIRDALSNRVHKTGTQGPDTSPLTRTEIQARQPAEDSVTLSPLSQQLESIEEAISRLPEIRKERIERIRRALASGTYRVASEQIADRILQETVRNSRHLP